MALMQKYGPDAQIDVRVSSRKFSHDERRKYIIYKHEGATGEWNWDMVPNLYDVEELGEWGMPEWKIEEFLPPEEPPPGDAEPQINRAEELREQWGVELGQMWRLPSRTEGQEHRLICGDCTDAVVVERVMGGGFACVLATDPPYGVDFEHNQYNPRAKTWDGIEGDKRQGQILEEWLCGGIKLWMAVCDKRAAFYFWTAAMTEGAAAAAIRSAGLHIQSQIIWNKNKLVLGQADYQWKHENCWYAFLKNKQHYWYGERDKTTVWDISKVANSAYQHPMQKPTELYEIPLRHHTKQGEVSLDPFCGSGSAIIAAENLSRQCRAIEISPAYVAVSLQRYVDAFGIEPELIS
jgi:DNA modification methylase